MELSLTSSASSSDVLSSLVPVLGRPSSSFWALLCWVHGKQPLKQPVCNPCKIIYKNKTVFAKTAVILWIWDFCARVNYFHNLSVYFDNKTHGATIWYHNCTGNVNEMQITQFCRVNVSVKCVQTLKAQRFLEKELMWTSDSVEHKPQDCNCKRISVI